MRFLYCSDLHGSIPKYEAVLRYAMDQGIKLIHIGADILPKGAGMMEIQKDFIKKYLKDFYKKAQSNNIDILAFWGNDDLYNRKHYFKEYSTLLDEAPFLNEYLFKAYGYVPDYKFGLKSGCKNDHPGWVCPELYIGIPVDYTDQGRVVIEDSVNYFQEKGTIKEDLEKIPVDNKTIMAIHCPPSGLGLDVCYDGREVGSKAVYDWILAKQPLMVLCGHIHESPEVTGVWKCYIGKTLVIQPGQRDIKQKDHVVMVDIEVLDSSINTKLIYQN